MSVVRATLLICATILLSIATVVFYNYYQDRYVLVTQEDGLYVFDRRQATVNYCDSDSCKAITPQFTLQAMIQAIPKQASLGTPNIDIPKELQSALAQPGSPFAKAQILLAQADKGKKKKSKKKSRKDRDDLDDNEEFDGEDEGFEDEGFEDEGFEDEGSDDEGGLDFRGDDEDAGDKDFDDEGGDEDEDYDDEDDEGFDQ